MEYILAALRSPGAELIKIGPFIIRWYGILIAIAVLLGLNLSNYLASLRGIRKDFVNDLMPILVLGSVIGARLYYVIFEWRNYKGLNFWGNSNFFGIKIPIPSFLKIWEGGIAIHGALIMGSILVFLFCRYRKENFLDVLDVLLPSVALGQAIGRWGNFFNNEAFGLPTNLPWKLFIPYASRPNFLINQSFFHPTFLYESLWNLIVFIGLITLFKLSLNKSINLKSGIITCLYLISYSFGRLWIEALRIDPLCLGSNLPLCEGGIRVAQLISFLIIALGSFSIFWIYKYKRNVQILGNFKKQKR